jgi:hypothetical protein
MKTILIIVVVFGILVSCTSQEQKIKNLEAFAKVYGYIKYFHPSDETTKIDWVKFSAYGAEKVENCITKQQLASTLTELFSPMAPSVRFVVSNTKPTYDLSGIIPQNTSGYKLTYWQHFGVSTGTKKFAFKNVYQSFRVNRDTIKGFDYQAKIEDVFTTEICDGIYCQIPMVLYGDEKSTYPKADIRQFKKLAEKIDQFNPSSEELSVKQGNVINLYNVIQHFYPYFEVVKVIWDQEFDKALKCCYTDLSKEDHLITLQKFTAPLKDGHIHFQIEGRTDYFPDISWEWIENKLVITHVSLGEKRYAPGDIVTKINGISPEKYFEEVKSRISAGTDSYLNFRANIMSLSGENNSVLNITVNDKEIDLKRYDLYYYRENKPECKQIGDGIYYLNMVQLRSANLNKLLPELVKANTIICDARGYPKEGEPDFICHLLKSDDTTRAWMQVPYFVDPDHKKIIGYGKFNWIQMMKAKKPFLGDKKIVYIIDGSAISYAESCLGYIEGYKLATIVGQPSAGTNGNVNAFELLGGSFSFTGMKVLKHNLTQHHGIGIIPNVYVNKTIQGIKEGRDEFLEKAISIAKQN